MFSYLSNHPINITMYSSRTRKNIIEHLDTYLPRLIFVKLKYKQPSKIIYNLVNKNVLIMS